MSAWVYQDDKQVKKRGADKASWYVGWIDPEGKKRCKSCGPGPEGRRNAEKLRKKREAELLTGTYQSNDRKTWAEFREELTAKVLDGLAARSREEAEHALDQYERLLAPKLVRAATTRALADFVALRRKEPGLEPGEPVSAATVNKELRHLRAALRRAHKWGYLPQVPDFDFLKESRKLPTYVPPDHFSALYQACESARLPAGRPFPASAWWRALLVTAYMTGWRIGALLALRRDDVDLDKGTAFSLAADTKGKRDQLVPLHPVVVEHLRGLADFDPAVFPWPYRRGTVFAEFGRIQEAAGVRPAGRKRRYGFHDLRRAFATMNADRLTPDALQALMQHQAYQTTQKYINMARQLTTAVQGLFVPDLPRQARA
jgi:integrase